MTPKKDSEERKGTRITKMEMKGFKSFANKVDILFGDGFNCILGPNGSGKSNVLDALCFVLGKAGSKSLRADKTANLIYNGGKTKKAAKTGEVHIYFDNQNNIFPVKHKEIKISRIVKSSGQSDYKINDNTATRTQIVDLLSHARINPDGYNIILQGDIVRLVEMSPNERRTIIEEISGINIYEEKKAKASRELDRVDQQLKEADIVLAERNTYLKELKKERDQAMKFRELDEKIKRNKATILSRKITDRNKKIDELQKKIDEEQGKINSVQKDIDNLKEQVLQKKKSASEVSQEIEEKGEKEQVALMKEAEALRTDLALKKQRQEQIAQELQRIATRRKDIENNNRDTIQRVERIEKDIAVSEKKIAARETDKARLTKKIDDFRKKNQLENASELDKRVQEIDRDAEKIQDEIQALRETQQNLLREKDRVEYQIQTIDERVNKVLEAQKENKEQLKHLRDAKNALTKTEKELSAALDRGSEIVPEIQTAKGKLDTRQEELNKLRARQVSINERAAGSLAVQKILALRSKNKKIYGTVAELGNVKGKFSLALEVAAGGRARSIVVEDDATAQTCIKYLKEHKLGVATFLPLNKIQTRSIPPELRAKKTGVHGLAVDLVRYDKKFEKAFLHVLGSTLVIEDITTARKLGIGKNRMVTLEGDLIESSGAMTGGHRARKSAGGAFQEEEVGNRLRELEKEVSDYEAVVSRLSREQSEINAKIDDLRTERHELENSVLALERELHIDSGDMDASKEDKDRLRAEGKDLDKQVDDVISQVSAKNKDLAKLKIEKGALREKITALQSPQLLAELNTFEQQRNKVNEEIIKIRTEANALRGQISSVHQRELENIKKVLDQQKKEESAFTKEQESLKKEISEMKVTLKDREQKESVFRKQFKELFEQRNKLQVETTKLEERIIREEEKIRRSEHTLNASSINMASLKAELAGVEEEFKEYKDVEPFKTKPESDIMLEIRQFEKMVDDLGAVNMKALEMYEHVEREYHSLVEKKDVLTTEREDVLLMINEIDAKKKELFMQTFNNIEGHFKRIFLTLSRKGDAFLELEAPEDPFSGGLTIRVRLTGNKFMDIRSLSGGEKTMTALAFLFAIQEYEPASFYVLDEVDAALDKKNSERLTNLIRGYCDDAQYVIISHNDTVIAEADALFGVSMNEHGESQVTSLKI